MTKKPRHLHVYSDRHGHERIYLRKPGQKRVPLPGPLFSYQFWEAYHRAAQGVAAKPSVAEPQDPNPPGSVSAAIMGYYGSAEYKQLADSSRGNRRRILERFRKEHGTKSLAKLETKHINAIIDKKADKPAAANELRKLLHIVFEYAISAGMLTDNPIKRAKRVKYLKRSHRAWTDEDVEAYRRRWPEGTPQRLGLELFIHTGLRRSDAVRMGWDHIKDGWIILTTVKSRHRKTLNIPIHPTLWHHIKDIPRGQRTFLRTKWDKDRSAKGATNWIRSAAHEAGLPSDSSPHGLRHAICVRLAEAGCTPHQIQAITGHDNLAEIETYTKAVSQRRLAQIAMDSLANSKSELANFDPKLLKVSEVLALPSGIEPLSPP